MIVNTGGMRTKTTRTSRLVQYLKLSSDQHKCHAYQHCAPYGRKYLIAYEYKPVRCNSALKKGSFADHGAQNSPV